MKVSVAGGSYTPWLSRTNGGVWNFVNPGGDEIQTSEKVLASADISEMVP